MATLPALGVVLERRQTTNTSSLVPQTTSSFVPPPTTLASSSSASPTSSKSSSSSPTTSTTSSGAVPFSSSSSSTTFTSTTSSTSKTSSSNPPSTTTTSLSTVAPTTNQLPTSTPPTTTYPPAAPTTTTAPAPSVPYSSYVSPGSLPPTLVGALTTTFTPPANCASPIISASGTISDYTTTGFGVTSGITGIHIFRSTCYPSQFSLANLVPIYSPGICPSGWAMHSYGVSSRPGQPELTTAGCCPVGATLSNSWMCVQTPIGTITSISGGEAYIVKTNSYRPISNYIQVAWEQTDCSSLPTGCPRSQTSTPSPGGLSSSAKIGIGVGVGVGGLLVLVGIIVAVLMMRKRRKRIEPAYTGVSQRYSSPPSYMTDSPEMKSNPSYELMAERRLTELSAEREGGRF